MEMTVGFIGTGNMGGALAKAAAKAVPAENIYLYDAFAEKSEALAQILRCNAGTMTDAARCSYVFLVVKPQMMESMFSQLAPVLTQQENTVLVSMAAGVSIARIQQLAGQNYPVIRIMPNMPVSVGEGMILYDVSSNVTDKQLDGFLKCMAHAGKLDRLPEKLIDAGTSVSGCGPAFAFLFIEALTQGGMECGLSEEQAMLYAKQMLVGSAKLAMESENHPAQLRQAVCSPGGSTIEGIYALQNGKFPETVIEAVKASYQRNQELGK